ncbi:MAG: hypothetical protein AAF206_19380, partial [Bacteroidota bacterium]
MHLDPSITHSLTSRQQVLQHIGRVARDWQYAILKWMHNRIEDFPEGSDLDIVIRPADLPKWRALLDQLSGDMQWRETRYGAFVQLFLQGGQYLELDLLHRLQWKGLDFLSIDPIIAKRKLSHEGLHIASEVDNFHYICWFFGLNACQVPQKYQDYLHKL